MKVGVIGAGTMGSGIAQAFAQTDGYEVVLCDIKQEFADGGKAKIEKNLARSVSKGRMAEAKKDEVLGKITTGLVEKDTVGDSDLIVEAILDKIDPAPAVFHTLAKTW